VVLVDGVVDSNGVANGGSHGLDDLSGLVLRLGTVVEGGIQVLHDATVVLLLLSGFCSGMTVEQLCHHGTLLDRCAPLRSERRCSVR
jgi:hypothetical protein